MGIGAALKKGLEVAAKSLLLGLAALAVLFVGYLIVGFILGGTILASRFPAITPGMTPDQINALDWSVVNWAIFIPGAVITALLGFLLNSFTQGGIIATLRDCIKEGRERISDFFANAVKYAIPLLVQLLIVVLVTILAVAIALVVMGLIAAIKAAPIIIIADVLIFVVLLALLLYIAMALVYAQISLVINNESAVKSLGQAMGFLKRNLPKALILFMAASAIYLAVYIVLQFLTVLTTGWPVVSRIIWSLLTSYVYIVVSVFMMGSFLSFYLAAENKSFGASRT